MEKSSSSPSNCSAFSIPSSTVSCNISVCVSTSTRFLAYLLCNQRNIRSRDLHPAYARNLWRLGCSLRGQFERTPLLLMSVTYEHGDLVFATIQSTGYNLFVHISASGDGAEIAKSLISVSQGLLRQASGPVSQNLLDRTDVVSPLRR